MYVSISFPILQSCSLVHQGSPITEPGPPQPVQRHSYGVVEEAGILTFFLRCHSSSQVAIEGKIEGYVPQKLSIQAHSAETVDYDPQALLFTQLPNYPDARFTDVPDGWSECMLPGSVKKTVLATPGFPKPILRPPTTVHCIKPLADGSGLGVFATENITMGDLIFSERPMYIGPAAHMPSGNMPSHFSMEQIRQATLFEQERLLQVCFGRMPVEMQNAFMALSNSHKHDGSGPLMGIIRTNAFGIEVTEQKEEDKGIFILYSVCV
jgi:hypothetical protein